MSRLNEEKLLAILFINLKGAKNKSSNWIEIAETAQKLSDHYGSPRKLADKIGVSYELMRTILRLLRLPQEVQQLIRDGKILYDAAQRIERISDPRRQLEIARASVGLTSHQTRDLIQYGKKYPDSDIMEYRSRILGSIGQKERINVIVLPLRQELYALLKKYSKERAISIERLALQVVSDWASSKLKKKP